jgi:hypothetical protein
VQEQVCSAPLLVQPYVHTFYYYIIANKIEHLDMPSREC